MPDDGRDQLSEIERLRERIRELEEIVAPTIDIPVEWRLTATEARIFSCLAASSLCSKRRIHAAAYGHWIDEAPPETILESHISKLRHKIKPFGYSISCERFAGYRLEHDHG